MDINMDNLSMLYNLLPRTMVYMDIILDIMSRLNIVYNTFRTL